MKAAKALTRHRMCMCLSQDIILKYYHSVRSTFQMAERSREEYHHNYFLYHLIKLNCSVHHWHLMPQSCGV